MADYIQWRNKNNFRYFPIADDASWVTQSGLTVPSSIFVDAVLTPIDSSGSVWVSFINFETGTVGISDDRGQIATAEITTDELSFYDTYGRHIGVVVLDPSFHDLAGALTFRAHALPFAPTAVVPQVQECVRGLLLPDGTLLTGDVVLTGIDGIVITTEITAQGQLVRFDALGESTEVDCIDLPPPIECVEVQQVGSGGVFAVELNGNVLNIDTSYQLEDMCQAKKDRKMPDEEGKLPLDKDVCGDPVEPEPCDTPVAIDPVSSCDTALYINVVSTLLGVELLDEPGMPAVDTNGGLTTLPARSRQGLKLFVRGLV